MDFAWTEEQERARSEAQHFAESELNEALRERDHQHRFHRDLWQKCADFGLLALPIPEAYGGLGLDARTAVYSLEGLGAGCLDNGLLMSLGAQLWSVELPLLEFGSGSQKERWLRALLSGQAIGAFALTEPDVGSDAFKLRTVAEKTGDGFVLHGAKTFVTNAPVADIFIVFAATEPAGGFFGLTAFLIGRDAPGLIIGRPLEKMGLCTSPTAELSLESVEVGPDATLGEVGGGAAVLRYTLEWERGCLLAPAVGTMARLLNLTTQYTRQRKQFGRPIIEFEAVGHQLAEMRLRLELSRLLLYRFAWLKDCRRGAATEASMCKLYISESLRFVSSTALHLHGAYGYSREYEFERDVRDATASGIYSGTTEMQRNLIAESLLLQKPREPLIHAAPASKAHGVVG
jgi:alkylation response protein AidB-like acyl-CoA dehydrogenase